MSEDKQPELTEDQKEALEQHKQRMEEDRKYKEMNIAVDMGLDSLNKIFEVLKYTLLENYELNRRIENLEKGEE